MKVLKKIKIPKVPNILKDLKRSKVFRLSKTPLICIVSNILFIFVAVAAFVIYAKVSNLDIEIRSPVLLTSNIEEIEAVVEEVEEVTVVIEENPNKEIEDFNDATWSTYYNTWLNTINSLSPVISCSAKMDSIHESLIPQHKEYLKKELNDERPNNELRFYEGVYRYTSDISGSLKGWTHGYGLYNETPDIVVRMYADRNYEDKGRTKESATIELNKALEYFREKREFANDLECIDLPEIKKGNKNKICEILIDFNHSFREFKNPIERDDYEFEENYRIRLKDRKEQEESSLENCKNYGTSY